MIMFTTEIHSPNSVATLFGLLTVRVKARCLIEVFSYASGIFPVNFHTKWLLRNVHVHFNYAGSRKVCFAVLGSVLLLNIIIIIIIIIIMNLTIIMTLRAASLCPPHTVWGLLPG